MQSPTSSWLGGRMSAGTFLARILSERIAFETRRPPFVPGWHWVYTPPFENTP